MIKKKIRNLVSFAVDIAEKGSIQRLVMESQKEYKNNVNKFDIELSKEEKIKIDSFYINNYQKKHIRAYHAIYKYFSGNFDEKYFPDDLGRVKLSVYANNKHFVESVSDKCFLPIIAQAAKVKMPEMIMSCSSGIYFDENKSIITRSEAIKLLGNSSDFIIKPAVDTGGGDGCQVFDNNSDRVKITYQIADEILQKYQSDFVVQKLVKPYESLKKLNPNSFNTFRLITYIIDGEIKHTAGVVMMGTNDGRCSNEEGFIFVGINEEGVLNKYAINKKGKNNISTHPDSSLVFEGHKIDAYPKIIKAAKQVHKFIPKIGIINWDFMLDEHGEPILIEANSRNGNGIFLIQSAQGESIFGDDTEKIMKWIKKMEKIGKTERYNKGIHL